jgi:hypothetical protein
MYDNGWNAQFTEFDIVDEGDVPLLMSLPKMRNLGFQFGLTPEKASFVPCTYWHEKNGFEDSHEKNGISFSICKMLHGT